jgi:hypothetical protein
MNKQRKSNPTKPSKRPSSVALFGLAGVLGMSLPWAGCHWFYREFDPLPRTLDCEMSTWIMTLILVELPLVMAMLGLLRKRKLRPWIRTIIAISPVLLLNLPGCVAAFFKPMRAKDSFAKCMGIPTPRDARDFKAWYTHAAGDSSYWFSFSCSSDFTQDLLEDGGYELDETPSILEPEIGELRARELFQNLPTKGWPYPPNWEGLQVYSKVLSDGGNLTVFTNRDRTQVFIIANYG